MTAALEFGAALGIAEMPFATPQVVDLLDDGECVITIERKVRGTPLRPDRTPAPPVVSSDEVRILGDVLDGLAGSV